MRSFKSRGKWIALVVVLLVFIALFIARSTYLERDKLTAFERGLRDVLAPMEAGITVVYNKVTDIPSYFVGVNELKKENTQLKTQVNTLQNNVNELKNAELQNQRLKEILDVEEVLKQSYNPITTTVIGRDPETWHNTITIQGGENKGFAKNMPVVSSDGLVGRISAVTKTTADVLLLLDSNGAVGGIIQDTRTPGVVEGVNDKENGQVLKMIHLPYTAKLEKKQVVLTSGLGGIYPADLKIGYIQDFTTEPGGLMLSATIKPYADFERLEEVMVLMPKN